jgi:glutamyl-Q tRNA(Asp) synthetase
LHNRHALAKHPVGRFAPSPSGALHFGSLIAATVSYLNVKQQQGKWLLRIDDIDTPRVVPSAIDDIQYTLEKFGFEWDALILQSTRGEAYKAALAQLQDQCYFCCCSRTQLKQRQALERYDQQCYHQPCQPLSSQAVSWRLHLSDNAVIRWQDQIAGCQQIDLAASLGDFILKRRDGIIAYHLACAVDDSDFGITEVIRGDDLRLSTAPQRYIQQCLGREPPNYGHHPLVFDQSSGIKLSKASKATPLDYHQSSALLVGALSFLQQQPPANLADAALPDIWQWALAHWDIKRLAQP